MTYNKSVTVCKCICKNDFIHDNGDLLFKKGKTYDAVYNARHDLMSIEVKGRSYSGIVFGSKVIKNWFLIL